jgi:hypothetical protein
MRVTFEQLPSPLMGEASGGGEDSTSSPHPDLPPPRGEGVLTSPGDPLGEGSGTAGGLTFPSRWLIHASLAVSQRYRCRCSAGRVTSDALS